MKATFFESAAAFGEWLERNHAGSDELLVGFHKKATGRGITYPEALDLALAYGWIDGVRRRVDDEAYTIRFTPRRAGSIWSAVNIRKVEELIRRGAMKAPGLAAFGEAGTRKTRQYSYEKQAARLDSALEAKLRASRKAAAFYAAQPPGYRRLIIHWVMDGKKEETRKRRLALLIEASAKGRRIDFMKPRGEG
jgi:uncharacterized protein YdeI (YjbR/CyaY-like superfamily)